MRDRTDGALHRQLRGHLDTVHPRHLDVEEGDVNLVSDDAVEDLVTPTDLGHDLEVGLHVQQCGQRTAYQRLVVGQ